MGESCGKFIYDPNMMNRCKWLLILNDRPKIRVVDFIRSFPQFVSLKIKNHEAIPSSVSIKRSSFENTKNVIHWLTYLSMTFWSNKAVAVYLVWNSESCSQHVQHSPAVSHVLTLTCGAPAKVLWMMNPKIDGDQTELTIGSALASYSCDGKLKLNIWLLNVPRRVPGSERRDLDQNCVGLCPQWFSSPYSPFRFS